MKFNHCLFILPLFILLVSIKETYSQSIYLNQTDSTKVKIINDSTMLLCSGQDISLNFDFCSSTETVLWSNGLFGNTILVNQTGQYYVSCSNLPNEIVDLVYVFFEDPFSQAPTISRLELSPLQNCDLKPRIQLRANCATSFPGLEWQNISANQVLTVQEPGTYSLACSNSCGISDFAHVVIDSSFFESNRFSVITPSNFYCFSDTLMLKANIPFVSADSFYNYFDSMVWSNGLLDTVTYVNQEGLYSFGLIKTGCSNTVWSDSTEILNGIEKPEILLSINNQIPIKDDSVQICDNEKLLLVSKGCQSGEIQWSNGLIGPELLVSESGFYSFVCVKICGISPPSDTIVVIIDTCTVQPLEPPVLTANRMSVCSVNDLAIITASCNNANLVWVNPSGVGENQLTVGPGVYSAYCQRNSISSAITEITITVTNSIVLTPPTIVTNKTILCGSETANLISVGCNANVVWSNNMIGNSISVNLGGLYTAICTNFCDSSVVSNSVTLIKILTTPPIINANKTSICGTENAVLTVSNCPISTIQWSNGQTGATIFATQGFYSVKCINVCGDNLESDTLEISQDIQPTKPTIVASDTILSQSGSISLSANGCNGILQWSNGLTMNSIVVLEAGQYHVICENQCGQISSDTIRIKNSNPVIPIIRPSKLSLRPSETATLFVDNCISNIIWNTGQTTPSIEVGVGNYSVSCNTIDGIQVSFSVNISNACLPVCVPLQVRKN